jgi:predicted ABC-type ATPase
MNSKPKMILIAGPNGSGKSTLTKHLKDKGMDFGEYVNPDDIALTLSGDDLQIMRKAQEIAATKRENLLDRGISHSFESVMSHPSKIEYMVAAKKAGFYVILLFVGIDDPLINVQRVANRVSKGGHDVPKDKIISRYNRTMEMLFEAATSADEALIFDNTDSDKGIQFSAKVKNGSLELHEPTAPWISKFLVRKFNKK